MKLRKSPKGKILIILFYVISGTAAFILMVLIMSKAGILIGLGVVFVIGVGIGIGGGELEFREHRNMQCKKRLRKMEEDKLNKIITFPKGEDHGFLA